MGEVVMAVDPSILAGIEVEGRWGSFAVTGSGEALHCSSHVLDGIKNVFLPALVGQGAAGEVLEPQLEQLLLWLCEGFDSVEVVQRPLHDLHLEGRLDHADLFLPHPRVAQQVPQAVLEGTNQGPSLLRTDRNACPLRAALQPRLHSLSIRSMLFEQGGEYLCIHLFVVQPLRQCHPEPPPLVHILLRDLVEPHHRVLLHPAARGGNLGMVRVVDPGVNNGNVEVLAVWLGYNKQAAGEYLGEAWQYKHIARFERGNATGHFRDEGEDIVKEGPPPREDPRCKSNDHLVQHCPPSLVKPLLQVRLLLLHSPHEEVDELLECLLSWRGGQPGVYQVAKHRRLPEGARAARHGVEAPHSLYSLQLLRLLHPGRLALFPLLMDGKNRLLGSHGEGGEGGGAGVCGVGAMV
eukprot:Sspe_Gene.40445::Locus_19530_Transcript_1_1_Confidence_1.000_Length_7240::g.40445::m.40445